MKRFGMIAALALALAALAAACGGGSSNTTTAQAESASDWATGVCGAMSTWVTSVQSAMSDVSKGNVSKDSLTTAGDDLKSATTTFVDDIKALGPPDTTDGQKAKDQIDSLADELSTDADTIKSALSDAANGTNIVGSMQTISTTAQKMGSQAQATVNSLKQLDPKGELKSAFQNAPNCKTLSSSSK